jgi:hypothetical protein
MEARQTIPAEGSERLRKRQRGKEKKKRREGEI